MILGTNTISEIDRVWISLTGKSCETLFVSYIQSQLRGTSHFDAIREPDTESENVADKITGLKLIGTEKSPRRLNTYADVHFMMWIIGDGVLAQVRINKCIVAAEHDGATIEIDGVGRNADPVRIIVVRANTIDKKNAVAVVVAQSSKSSVFADVNRQCGRAGDFDITPVIAPEDVYTNLFAVSISPRRYTRQVPEREFPYGGVGLQVRRGRCRGWSRCRGTDRCCWSGRRSPPPPATNRHERRGESQTQAGRGTAERHQYVRLPPVIGQLAQIVAPHDLSTPQTARMCCRP